jgi:hypothetical protein
MLKAMIPQILQKLEEERHEEAFVNLDGLICFMHENIREFSAEDIFCVVSAHDALSITLFEADPPAFNGKETYCAHVAYLRLREALGDMAAGRAANALTFCLEALATNNQHIGNDERQKK